MARSSVLHERAAAAHAIRVYAESMVAAVKLIRQWHGMGLEPLSEQLSWGIYYSKSPEMAPIRELFAKDPTQEKS